MCREPALLVNKLPVLSDYPFPSHQQQFTRERALELAKVNGESDRDWTYQAVCVDPVKSAQVNWSVAMFDEENVFVGYLG